MDTGPSPVTPSISGRLATCARIGTTCGVRVDQLAMLVQVQDLWLLNHVSQSGEDVVVVRGHPPPYLRIVHPSWVVHQLRHWVVDLS